MLFQFRLRPLEEVEPWGGEKPALHWFGLSDGWCWWRVDSQMGCWIPALSAEDMAPKIWLWAQDATFHLRWDNLNVLRDGIPVWDATYGEITMPVTAFVEEVSPFTIV